jgi:lysophospholipase L1-like esterase
MIAGGASRQLSRYVAIGDSVSIDLYPQLDLSARGDSPPSDGVGAASLLHSNIDSLWPEFTGQDLSSARHGIEYVNLCADGTVTGDVLDLQLPSLPTDDGDATLVTLTVGGNDLLSLIGRRYDEGVAELQRIIDRTREIVREVRSWYRDLTLVLATVYDPSDGAAHLGDGIIMRREWEWLGVYNEAVRRMATATGCLLAEVHDHFFGHGLSERDPSLRWYWSKSIIEPSAQGASEVRRLWLRCLDMEP